MDDKIVFSIILLALGVFLQFFFGVSGLSCFLGSIMVLMSPLFFSPGTSGFESISVTHWGDKVGKTKKIPITQSLDELQDKINECRCYNESIANPDSNILKIITIMRVVGAFLCIFMIVELFCDNPHLGAIVVDAVFIPYFLFKLFYPWPVKVFTPNESTICTDSITINAIMQRHPDNPYFDYERKAILKYNEDDHVHLEGVDAKFKLKKKLPNLLCAQVQIAHNLVMNSIYPYAYFVMVYPEKWTSFVTELQNSADQFILDNKISFQTEIKHADGNVILIVRLSDNASVAYHTSNGDCAQLSDVMIHLLEKADISDGEVAG